MLFIVFLSCNMEEIKLFDELNFIKNEIEKDLNNLDKIQNDLKIRVVYDNNKELSDRVCMLTNDYNLKISELKNHNLSLEKEIVKVNSNLGEKDKEIIQMKENMKNLIEENKNLLTSLNKIKSKIYFV